MPARPLGPVGDALDRRRFLKTAAATGAAGLVAVTAPAFVRPAFSVMRSADRR